MADIDKNEKTDFISAGASAVCGLQWKLGLIVFLCFIILCSDIFVSRVLSRFDNAVDRKAPTSWGVILQGIFLVLSLLLSDCLLRLQII